MRKCSPCRIPPSSMQQAEEWWGGPGLCREKTGICWFQFRRVECCEWKREDLSWQSVVCSVSRNTWLRIKLGKSWNAMNWWQNINARMRYYNQDRTRTFLGSSCTLEPRINTNLKSEPETCMFVRFPASLKLHEMFQQDSGRLLSWSPRASVKC